jgi:hypothetical protein
MSFEGVRQKDLPQQFVSQLHLPRLTFQSRKRQVQGQAFDQSVIPLVWFTIGFALV